MASHKLIFIASNNGYLVSDNTNFERIEQNILSGNSSYIIEATPDLGYEFECWTSQANNEIYLNSILQVEDVFADNIYVAIFKPVYFNIVFTSTNYGEVIGQSQQRILKGHNSSFVTANSIDSYFTFAYWEGDYFGTTTPLMLVDVQSDKYIQAVFTSKLYYMECFVYGEHSTLGIISGTLYQEVPAYINYQPIVAIPKDGSEFDYWEVTSGNETTVLYDNPLVVTNNQKHNLVIAFFKETIYTLSYKANIGGSIKENPTLCLTALADQGYIFYSWVGDIISQTNPLYVDELTENIYVEACFISTYGGYVVEFNSFDLSKGYIYGNIKQSILSGGMTQGVEAKAYDGYSFLKWAGDRSSLSNPIIISNVSTNLSIVAYFTRATYIVSFSCSGDGSAIEGELLQSVLYMESGSSVIAVHNDYSFFSGWYNKDTDELITTDYSIVATDVNSNISYQARFIEKVLHTITFSTNGGGSIVGEAVQQVYTGESCTTISGAPIFDGASFVEWVGDFSSTEASITISGVVSDMAIVGIFDVEVYSFPPDEDQGVISPYVDSPELSAECGSVIIPTSITIDVAAETDRIPGTLVIRPKGVCECFTALHWVENGMFKVPINTDCLIAHPHGIFLALEPKGGGVCGIYKVSSSGTYISNGFTKIAPEEVVFLSAGETFTNTFIFIASNFISANGTSGSSGNIGGLNTYILPIIDSQGNVVGYDNPYYYGQVLLYRDMLARVRSLYMPSWTISGASASQCTFGANNESLVINNVNSDIVISFKLKAFPMDKIVGTGSGSMEYSYIMDYYDRSSISSNNLNTFL